MCVYINIFTYSLKNFVKRFFLEKCHVHYLLKTSSSVIIIKAPLLPLSCLFLRLFVFVVFLPHYAPPLLSSPMLFFQSTKSFDSNQYLNLGFHECREKYFNEFVNTASHLHCRLEARHNGRLEGVSHGIAPNWTRQAF